MTRPQVRAKLDDGIAAAVSAIVTTLDRIIETPPQTWTCGVCGCLCFVGETCPKCRYDLFTNRSGEQK